ncbi:hypothetical protein NIE88_18870 [Sporolactobacillus shoreicorticis]|uniref:Uncharacterized protein n=1 Tax=Sporolactobacillus shoreicorticis TaxID=1923877 RepID=A0ABW5S8Z7_9BACL|nr:hypothetical protein [Sporolactobacillus shoreicorticis]MCO7127813.1 hypothetical protein [Sporolactobacillus shoreicorticis]
MAMYAFKRLIDKYNVSFDLQRKAEGRYDDSGEGVEGLSDPEPGNGAIVPLPQSLIYQSGGALTQYDRNLYTDLDIPLQSKINYKDVHYTIVSKTPFSDYADFNLYVLKSDDTQNSGGLS